MAIKAVRPISVGGTVVGSSSHSVSNPTAAALYTDVFDLRAFWHKTLYFTSTADQALTVQVEGSYDSAFSDTFSVGSSIAMSAGNVTTQRTFAILTDYHPYVRVKVTAASNSTGTFACKVEAQGMK